jgi:hypothetical protein
LAGVGIDREQQIDSENSILKLFNAFTFSLDKKRLGTAKGNFQHLCFHCENLSTFQSLSRESRTSRKGKTLWKDERQQLEREIPE